mmetsp:Transcript_2954/g.5192  ORF Transcript_2954/g.5192 Transcript_2954/m.5192 type:complete len:377 (-) Transcript_2954:18-1148(-)
MVMDRVGNMCTILSSCAASVVSRTSELRVGKFLMLKSTQALVSWSSRGFHSSSSILSSGGSLLPNTSKPLGPAVLYHLARNPQIDVALITPTGPGGRILKGDVLLAVETGSALRKAATSESVAHSAPPIPPSKQPSLDTRKRNEPVEEEEDIEFHDILVDDGKMTAAQLSVDGKKRPHLYASKEFSVTEAIHLSTLIGGDVTVTDILYKSVGAALREVPELNKRWNENTGRAESNESHCVVYGVRGESGESVFVSIEDSDHVGLKRIARERINATKETKRSDEMYPAHGSVVVASPGLFPSVDVSAIALGPFHVVVSLRTNAFQIQVNSGSPEVSKQSPSGLATLVADARFASPHAVAKFMHSLSTHINNPSLLLA